MTSESVTIRQAKPTYDDGVAYAGYVDMASEGGIRIALGRRFTDIIATAFMVPDHGMSYEHVVFAEHDGITVGMAAGHKIDQHERSSDLPLRKAPGSRVSRTIGLALLGLFLRVIGDHVPGDFYLHFLAVGDDCRGRGIGSSLIESMESRALAVGAARFSLDVSAKNSGAQKLYERHGLVVESETPKSRFLPTFVRRMVKDL